MKAFAFSLCAISPVVIVLCAFYVAYLTVFFFFLFFFFWSMIVIHFYVWYCVFSVVIIYTHNPVGHMFFV